MVKILPWLLLAALAPAQDPADGEWERPWNGLLPDRDQGFGDEKRPGSEWLATRILDAATGLPVPGARLLRTPERIDDSRLRHDAVMSAGAADADGVARVPALEYRWREDCHWLAVAPGYAPVEDYGPLPEPEMLLGRGIPMSFRVLDPLGRPVPGAVLEFLGGCSHGTAGARAIAGADGVATFPNLDPGSGQLWVFGPGIASDLVPLPDDDALGTRPDDLVMGFGARYEGRILDLLGEPLQGCVVRALNEHRGPTAVTGSDGRFVIEGVEGGNSLYFYPPADLAPDRSDAWLDDAMPGIPFTVTVTPLGVAPEDATAKLVVRARGPDGKPAADVSYRLVHGRSGRGPRGTTEAEEEKDAVEEAAPGSFRVVPGDPFGESTFDPAEVRAAAGETTVVVLPVRPQPRLRIRGEIPAKADLVLAVEGDTEPVAEAEADASWSPPLPAAGTAVLRVEVDGRPPHFFPVGPAKEGFREVVVSLPAPRRIPLPRGAKDARLLQGTRGVLSFQDGEALCTDATGPLTIRWRDQEGRTREVEAASPGAAPRTVVRKVRIRALGAGEDGKETAFHDEETGPGKMVVVGRDGWRTLRAVAPERDVDLRWGTAALRLTILQAAKDPPDPLVLVDGEVYTAPKGVLHLRGLEPGPHRVVAANRDEVRGGRELRLVLRDGETRERTVTLGEE